MTIVKLREILTPDQMKSVAKICADHPDLDKLVSALKTYLSSIRDDLERQEFYPEYLAFAIANNAIKIRRERPIIPASVFWGM